MNQFSSTPLQDRLGLEAMMQTHKPGDYLVLNDQVLAGALSGSRPLRESEWQALMDSPLTLRRMRVLEAQRLAAEQAQAEPALTKAAFGAANDPVWGPCVTQLRAAADGLDGSFLQASDNGHWMLYALKTGAATRLLLRLQPEAEHADQWLAARPELAVLDAQGNTLLCGMLDEDGELQGPWVHDTDLRTYLAAHGYSWTVERV